MSNNPKSSMIGFDAEFQNLDHYIRVITDRIWEGGRIDDIYTYYSDPCIVETPSSVSTALIDVVNGTRATLEMFPDRRLLAEDVIQSGDAQTGFLSSHRIISAMTHRGNGNFGVATNKRIHVRTVADCVCINNRIVHEWLVRDQAAIAVQIGSSAQTMAQAWLNQRDARGWTKPIAGAAPHGYESHISQEALAQAYASNLQDFAQGHGAAKTVYDDAVHHIGPGGKTYFGQDEVAQFWQQLFGALKVKSLQIEHLALQTGNGRADRLAVRWRAQTQHDGAGRYGAATGKPVEILGINHVEFYAGRVLREWVLIDDVALWMQVLA